MTTQTMQRQKNSEGSLERFEDRPTVAPPVDVFEGPDQIRVVADLPGVSKSDLLIELENGELRFRAKARPFGEEAGEFDWARAFRVPPGIDGSKVTADLREGVLVLTLPKPAELKPRKIEVRAG